MAFKKLTKKQRELLKKFGVFRRRQKTQRARLAQLRKQIHEALAQFTDEVTTLSEFKAKREAKRLARLSKRFVNKIG